MLGGRLTKPAQAGHLSIVVLPFANLSGDPAQDYFADGITDNLTTEISRLAGVEAHSSRVIARNTAFTYKGNAPLDFRRHLPLGILARAGGQRDPGRARARRPPIALLRIYLPPLTRSL